MKTTSIKEHDYVAISVTENLAPLTCYVGEVQSVSKNGIQITLIDWIVGAPCGWDLFIRHQDILCALVASTSHDKANFLESAASWQTKVEGKNRKSVQQILGDISDKL